MERRSNAVVLLVLAIAVAVLASRSADEEPRQLANLLPSWLSRIRNGLPSALTRRRASTDNPAGEKKPAEVLNWPAVDLDVGQISGVAVDEKSNPVILHRGHISWVGGTFDGSRRYQHAAKGPIKNDTIVTLDAATGALLDHWGADMFYMPHGLEIDLEGNTWVTDVALHQVFKFPKGSRKPSMTLGEAFTPGSDHTHFCQPTDVAVASSGVFFVADGYCNKRIIKYDPSGQIIGEFKADFNVPHSLALVEELDALCVADRDNDRLICIHAGLRDNSFFGVPHGRTSANGKNIGKVYGIAAKGKQIYAVITSIFFGASEGKTVDLDTLQVKSHWTPSKGFSSPHDVAVSRDGEALYVVEIGPNRVYKFALE